MMDSFKINELMTLKLEKNGRTSIYVAGKPFKQCTYLLLTIPRSQAEEFADIKSIDDAAERLDKSMHDAIESKKFNIPPRVEFWGHCSNLQAWAENGYNLNLIHSNLGFPLVKKLSELGDPQATAVFKEEVARRFQEGDFKTKQYLFLEFYFRSFTKEELEVVLKDLDFKKISAELTPRKKFSLLEELIGLGNAEARRILKEKVLKRFKKEGEIEIDRHFIVRRGYLDILSQGEIDTLFSQVPKEDYRLASVSPSVSKTFPYYLLKLNYLGSLDYSYCDIEELSESIGKLTSLHTLELNGNNLKRLPESIANLNRLEELNLGYNKFEEFPQQIITLERLKKLYMDHNKLNELPESIGKMKRLRLLFITDNNLKELPESIGELKFLRELWLERNSLTSLPESIGNLKNLKRLYLNDNYLTELPETIGNLENLESLGLSSNNLKRVPDTINNLKKLDFTFYPHSQRKRMNK